MKKMISLALSTVCAAAMIPGTAFAAANEEVSGTITIWEHDYSFEDSLVNVIEGFEALYPNVEVNYEIKSGDDYYSLLSTAIQSGDGPDLFWTNGTATSNMEDFVSNDALEELTDVVDFGFITENAMELANIDGKSYSVPWMTMDTRTCYYNKDLFAENGWEIPQTFSEFETLLADIKEAGITPVSMSFGAWSLLFAYEPIMAGFDAEYTAGLSDYTSKTTDQPARDCLQKMVDWANAGYFGDNWTGVIDSSSQILAFTTGNAAMNIGGSWDAETIRLNNPDLNYGAFAIPAEDGTTGLVGTSANGFSVNAASKNLDAANAFANYCASKEAQTIWVQTLGAVSASPEIEAGSDIAREISESGQGNVYRSWQNVLSSYSTTGNAVNIWQDDFTKVFTGDMSVDEFMDELEAEME